MREVQKRCSSVRKANRVKLVRGVVVSVPVSADPIVRTGSGPLRGILTADGTVAVYRGVPYARAPVGNLRWAPPMPCDPWSEVRAAEEAGPACPQPNAGPQGFYTDPPPRMSEDCLYLNVWAPQDAEGAPVMVFIHGGALITGHGGSPRYDGAELARRGIVVVTINYRLGIFGFFSHPELSAESPNRTSGNYGTLDQIAALRWVQREIARFGGDPSRVTVFGQSAGAASVTLLMASPLARGLFQGAIAQSGYLGALAELRTSRFGLPAAEEAGARFGDRHNASSLAELRAMPADAVLAAAADNPNHTFGMSAPVVDGWVQPAQIFETFEAGRQAKVPLVAGVTSGEVRSFDPGVLPTLAADRAAYEARVRAAYGDDADAFLAVYPSSDLEGSSLAAARDAYFSWGTERLLQLHAQSGQPAWLYYFDHVYPSAAERGVGAFHSCEVPFVLGNVGPGAIAPRNWPSPPGAPSDVAMSGVLMDYWSAFAKTGRPAPAGQPAWPAFTHPSGGYLAFRDGAAIPSNNLLPGAFEVHDAHMRRLRDNNLNWTWANIAVPDLSDA